MALPSAVPAGPRGALRPALRLLRRRSPAAAQALHGSSGADPGAPPGLLANVGALALGRVLVASLGWAASVIVVRSLSLADFGRFTFIFSVLGMLSVITDLQIGRIAVTRLAAGPADPGAFGGSYVLLRLLLGLVGYVLAVGWVAAAGYPRGVVAATAVAALVVVAATPSHAYDAVFEARMDLRRIAGARTLGTAAQLVLTAAVASAGGTLLLFTVPAVLCELVGLGWKIPVAHRLLPFRYRVDRAEWRSMLREAIPLSIGTAMMTVYYRIDSVMLTKLATFSAVGLYGVAYKFVDLVHFAPIYVSMATLPLLVRSWRQDTAAFRAATARAAALLGLAGGLVVSEFTLFAEPVIRTLYGAQYTPAADAARIVVGSECIAFFTILAFTCLVAAGLHRQYPLVTTLGLVVNVTANLLVIPRWSYVGAAADTLVTDILVCVLMARLLHRLPEMRPLPLPPWRRLLCAGACALAAGWATARLTYWPVAALVTAAVYAAVLLVSASRGGHRARRTRSTEEDA